MHAHNPDEFSLTSPQTHQLSPTSPNLCRKPCPLSVTTAVVATAVLLAAVSISACPLWFYPNSIEYMILAGELVEGLDFSHELFLLRTPGYPAMLAGIFKVAGEHGSMAIKALQHGCNIATAALVCWTAWELTRRRSTALLAGLLTAASLPLIAYANVIMSEVPYTLALTAAVYCMVRYHQADRRRWILAASLAVGLAYMIRPLGIVVLAGCGIAILHLAWRASGWGARCRKLLLDGSLAAIPAAAMVLAWGLSNAAVHNTQQTASTLGLALYHRAAYVDNLNDPDSRALAEIRQAVADAQTSGKMSDNANYRLGGAALAGLNYSRGMSFAPASQLLHQAAMDLIRPNWKQMARRTLDYALWMVLRPDSTYRFHPDGAPGHACKRAVGAEIFDIATYRRGPGSYERHVSEFKQYLPFHTDARPMTPLWTGVARWSYRHLDKGGGFQPAGRSVYELFMILCLLGAGGAMLTRRRMYWLPVIAVLGLHLLATAALAGHEPRYAIPVQPLLRLCGAFALVGLARILWVCRMGFRGALYGQRVGEASYK